MIRTPLRRSDEHPGIPRESGDDPPRVEELLSKFFVFPARAGMIPMAATLGDEFHGIPRESGDDPEPAKQQRQVDKYSPRERG